MNYPPKLVSVCPVSFCGENEAFLGLKFRVSGLGFRVDSWEEAEIRRYRHAQTNTVRIAQAHVRGESTHTTFKFEAPSLQANRGVHET